MKRLTPGEQNRLAIKWNLQHRIGTPVTVRLDDGKLFDTRTRSAAWLMGGHSAMVMVEGIAGGYSLQRISPMETPNNKGKLK